MRNKFNLDVTDLKRPSVLLQGIPNSGKTHLAGDMLRTEAAFGPVRFINIKGEDGYASIAHMGLGNIGVTVDAATDVRELTEEFIRDKVHGAVLDGARLLYGLLLVEMVQSDPKFSTAVRLPDARYDGEKSKGYWSQARFQMEQTITLLKTAVNVLLVTSTSAQDVHEVTGKKQIAPDIYGKMGSGLIGLLDFSGYIVAESMGPGRVQRKVSFEVRDDVQTRQRLAFPLTEPIVLPDGFGGWAKIKTALTGGLGKEKK
jgi:hypothetical protein